VWQLQAIGIKDLANIWAKETSGADAVRHFHETVKITGDKRYKVCLLQKEGHAELIDDKDLAEKRLVFQEWLKSGIVELVPDSHGITCHCLPHQVVIKELSMTT
jgi:hypothetical protein